MEVRKKKKKKKSEPNLIQRVRGVLSEQKESRQSAVPTLTFQARRQERWLVTLRLLPNSPVQLGPPLTAPEVANVGHVFLLLCLSVYYPL